MYEIAIIKFYVRPVTMKSKVERYPPGNVAKHSMERRNKLRQILPNVFPHFVPVPVV